MLKVTQSQTFEQPTSQRMFKHGLAMVNPSSFRWMHPPMAPHGFDRFLGEISPIFPGTLDAEAAPLTVTVRDGHPGSAGESL